MSGVHSCQNLRSRDYLINALSFHLAAVRHPVKRRALIGSREALDVRPARLSLKTIVLRAWFAGRGGFLVVFAAEHLGRVGLDVSVSVA